MDPHHPEQVILGIAAILSVGVASQWAAWRLGLPSVLLLMAVAFVAGPVLGWLHPDTLLGDLLTPLVSISVGLVLFEGGLSLEFPEIKNVRAAVFRVVGIGAIVTWVAIAFASWLILALPLPVAILFGALLTVTGPTVIIPMLRALRVRGSGGAIAKWEGIINDPLMVICAVLVFEAILGGAMQHASEAVARGLFLTIFVGGGLGIACGWGLQFVLQRHLVPDYLHIALTLGVFALCFAIPNMVQHEAGLVSVTLMGMFLANQKGVAIRHIIEFKENVRTLLIAALFIVLTARLTLEDFASAGWESLVFAAVLILLVRPIAIYAALTGTNISGNDKKFLAWLAPRGIVAASLAALFAERLTEIGYEGAERLAPVTIVVVATTVAVYGLTTPIVARRLGLSLLDPQGLLIMGAHPWARKLAKAVKDAGFEVLLVDTNWKNVSNAKMEDLRAFYGSLLDEESEHRIDMSSMGRFIGLTRNDQANALAATHMIERFGRARVFQLAQSEGGRGAAAEHLPSHLRGRVLFKPGVTFEFLDKCFAAGWEIKATPLTDEFKLEEFKKRYGEEAVPLFLATPAGALHVVTPEADLIARDHSKLIALIPPEDEADRPAKKDEKKEEKDA